MLFYFFVRCHTLHDTRLYTQTHANQEDPHPRPLVAARRDRAGRGASMRLTPCPPPLAGAPTLLKDMFALAAGHPAMAPSGLHRLSDDVTHHDHHEELARDIAPIPERLCGPQIEERVEVTGDDKERHIDNKL